MQPQTAVQYLQLRKAPCALLRLNALSTPFSCTGALRRGAASDLGRGDRHSHARRGRNSNRHNERESQKSMNDLDDDDNFSMRFQTLDEVVGQVCSFRMLLSNAVSHHW